MPEIEINSNFNAGKAGASFGYGEGGTFSSPEKLFMQFLNNPNPGTQAAARQALGSEFSPMLQGFMPGSYDLQRGTKGAAAAWNKVAADSQKVQNLSVSTNRSIVDKLSELVNISKQQLQTERGIYSAANATSYEASTPTARRMERDIGSHQTGRAPFPFIGLSNKRIATPGWGGAVALGPEESALAHLAQQRIIAQAGISGGQMPVFAGGGGGNTFGGGGSGGGRGGGGGGGGNPPFNLKWPMPPSQPPPRGPAPPFIAGGGGLITGHPRISPEPPLWNPMPHLRAAGHLIPGSRVPMVAGGLAGGIAGALVAGGPLAWAAEAAAAIGTGVLLSPQIAGASYSKVLGLSQPAMGMIGSINSLALLQGNATTQFRGAATMFRPSWGNNRSNRNTSWEKMLGLSPQAAAALSMTLPIAPVSNTHAAINAYSQAILGIGTPSPSLYRGFAGLNPAIGSALLNQGQMLGVGSNPLLYGAMLNSVMSNAVTNLLPRPGLAAGILGINQFYSNTAGGINGGATAGFAAQLQAGGAPGALAGTLGPQILGQFQGGIQSAYQGNPFTTLSMVALVMHTKTRADILKNVGLTETDIAKNPELATDINNYLLNKQRGNNSIANIWMGRILSAAGTPSATFALGRAANKWILPKYYPNNPSLQQTLAPAFTGADWHDYYQAMHATHGTLMPNTIMTGSGFPGVFYNPKAASANAGVLTGPFKIPGGTALEIAAAAQANNIPSTLLGSILLQEHGGSLPGGPYISSSAGAMGIGQVMPSTAAGLPMNRGKTMAQVKARLQDESLNEQMAAQYISQLSKTFHGNPFLIAEAYNAGPGAVQSNFAGWSAENRAKVKAYATGVVTRLGLKGTPNNNLSPLLAQSNTLQTRAGGAQLNASMQAFQALGPVLDQFHDALVGAAEATKNVQDQLFQSGMPL